MRIRTLLNPPGSFVYASKPYAVGDDRFLYPDPEGSDVRRILGCPGFEGVDDAPVEEEEPHAEAGAPVGEEAPAEVVGPVGEEAPAEVAEPILSLHHKTRQRVAKGLSPEYRTEYTGKNLTAKADACILHWAEKDPGYLYAVAKSTGVVEDGEVE